MQRGAACHTLFQRRGRLVATPAAHELEVALQGRNVAYRLEGEAGQLRMIVLMPRAGE